MQQSQKEFQSVNEEEIFMTRLKEKEEKIEKSHMTAQ